MLSLRPQEIPLDDARSSCMFRPSPGKPFRVTPAALAEFGLDVIACCLDFLQKLARRHEGLQYVQVFEEQSTNRRLWFIEDSGGGAITALLPSDY
jgi:hypothetical protein